jgi:hypothetical protein
MRPLLAPLCALAGLALSASPALAQYLTNPAVPEPVVGEDYHVEFAANLWRPGPDIVISSEGLGIIGSEIDFVVDLGLQEKNIGDYRITLRPGRKHKFHADFLPIRYSGEASLNSRIIFNGIAYDIGVTVGSSLTWDTWNLFYEYDFIYRDRFYVGFLLGAKYTQLRAEITSPVETQFTEVKFPIPALGGSFRVYPIRNLQVTGTLTLFDMPEPINGAEGQYYDVDVSATYNVTNNIGIQGGFRSIEVEYAADQDSGRLDVDGAYVGAVVRF